MTLPGAGEPPLAWPAVLAEGPVTLRPIRVRDARRWNAVRNANRNWLEPWDATTPSGDPPGPANFAQYARGLRRQARAGGAFPWLIEYQGTLAGQLTVSGITRGPLLGGSMGYWVAEEFAGREIAPTAVALAFDHCVTVGGLHRLELTIRPENTASLRVVQKLGFREEGVRRRFLHVAGEWRDHRVFALTGEEAPGGLMDRWRRVRRADA
ncbi:MAG: GNAT family N-acetyltransferase [Bifidobacteriaceae bacterium]|jgi:ribosomal-protein-alanine N-acetyltransferase|nr:GNAT family N-acetyltransferase [Bifidobacteriaceae bacterium]